MSMQQDLERLLPQLETALATAADEIAADPLFTGHPYRAKTIDGRYVVLDALTALVGAKSALLLSQMSS